MASAGEDTPMVDPDQLANLFTFRFPYTPRFGWDKAPPTSASNPPPPPSGQGVPPSTSNPPPPPSGQRASGSNPAAPPSRNSPPPLPRGQGSRNPPGAPPSGSNPAPPPPRDQGRRNSPPPPSGDQGSRTSGQGNPNPPPPSSRSQGHRSSGQGGWTPRCPAPEPEPPAAAGEKWKSPQDEPGPQLRCCTGALPNPGSAPKRPRTDGVPKSAKAKKSAKSKSGPKNWGIPRSEVPDSAAGLQDPDAQLNGILASAIPPTCLGHLKGSKTVYWVLTTIAIRYSNPSEYSYDSPLSGCIKSCTTNSVYEQVATFLHTARAMNSQTASDVVQVGSHHLRSMYNAVANVGLHVFAPDIFGNPESFFIYGHMKDLASKEERRPGRVGVDIMLNNIYRRHDKTQALCVAQIADDCFMNKTVARLAAENECHSDDEELADGSAFMVHEKPACDSAVSAFFEVLTARRETAISQKHKKGAWHRRIRKRGLPPSDLSRARPTNVPIDCFSPQFFNDLSVWDCAIYMKNGVALPTAEHCQTWTDIAKWKGLGKVDFMAQYGKAKLALYELPTEAELAALDDDSMDNDDWISLSLSVI
ncbi:hypothetical protein DFH08DRAFT_820481 [Mycena albidolilacea]|uniref:Uncharacterized protein n=1 Tax=Mycena albidolilacea TaxID=1033008 RepID=A0AAD6ZD84_9AGAR|nr:hypothetical protein DFH08DRAFT_820481 [Mycena albidolilacea]